MNEANTTREAELVELIDEMPIEDVIANFTALMQSSIDDDPNSQQEVAA